LTAQIVNGFFPFTICDLRFMKKRNLLVRVIIIAAVTLAALYAVFMPHNRLPAPQDFTITGLRENLATNIHLGLDLKGGSHLVMRVKTEDYLKSLTEGYASAALAAAKEAGLPVTNGTAQVDQNRRSYQIVLETSDTSKTDEIVQAVKKKIGLQEWSQSGNGNQIIWSLPVAEQTKLSAQAVTQAKNIIENRINTLGVTEPTLQTLGGANGNQLLLQMPGLQDPERAKRIIGAESKLDLMKVYAPGKSFQTFPTEEAAKASLGGTVPANRLILPYIERDTNGQNKNDAAKPTAFVIVETPPIITGDELRDAQAISRTGAPDDYQIMFYLKPSGGQKFGEWTGKNVGEYLAVVLNGQVKSAPVIKSQIFDQGTIEGRFTKQSAEDLALTLKSGALPATIEYQEERTVGPSLGADSIRAGVTASVAGVIFVMLFMLIYYKGAGVNAVVALLLNMLLTLAALVLIGATLTLPGIAGIILGIGMAVDSNVLIFERIREELRAGKDVLHAVDLGFDRAFVTIIDTHLTTIISSLLLYMFGGAGPIKGFAVTLILGLLINLFSAVFVSRTIFIWLFGNRRQVEKISI
jgi:preprotein translocase subunit SecD